MTATEKYQAERDSISEALTLAEVAELLYNKDNIPKKLPCAILILDSETGKHGTSRQYVNTDIAWTVFLIVNAQNVQDPDSELYSLKDYVQKVVNSPYIKPYLGAAKKHIENEEIAERSRLKILEMLEVGKINSEEAERLLKAISKE